jgi:hypothetical protein
MPVVSLVKALKSYFELDGATMIREFKELTDKDKTDFVEMFSAIGIEVERPAEAKAA